MTRDYVALNHQSVNVAVHLIRITSFAKKNDKKFDRRKSETLKDTNNTLGKLDFFARPPAMQNIVGISGLDKRGLLCGWMKSNIKLF
jgi:hypothetical protein